MAMAFAIIILAFGMSIASFFYGHALGERVEENMLNKMLPPPAPARSVYKSTEK